MKPFEQVSLTKPQLKYQYAFAIKSPEQTPNTQLLISLLKITFSLRNLIQSLKHETKMKSREEIWFNFCKNKTFKSPLF